MSPSNKLQGIRGPVPIFLNVFSAVLVILLGSVSCAPHSYEIRSADVPLDQYEELSCTEVYAEMNSRLRKLEELGSSIDETAETDETQTAVGLILVWPALFWLEGSDTPEAQEYAQIRGEMLSLEHTAILKDCVEAKALATEWREEEKQLREAREEEEKKKKEQQSQQMYDDE